VFRPGLLIHRLSLGDCLVAERKPGFSAKVKNG